MKPTTSPPSGQAEDSRQADAGAADQRAGKGKDRKKDKYDTGEKKDWKEREMSEGREGEKRDRKDVGKPGKHEHGRFDKEIDREGAEKKKQKEWKKEKAVRGDDGKPWKARDGKKERTEKSERKEEKEWKKAKHDKVRDGKQWRDEGEKKDWKRGNEHGESHRGREDWKRENERKKVKGGLRETGKEKWERKEWKSKKDWREGKAKGERKPWEESENHGKQRGKERKEKEEWKGKITANDKEWKRKDGRKQWDQKDNEWNNQRKKDRPSSQQHKHELTSGRRQDHDDEHVWGDGKPPHTHRRPSLGQPEYWLQQRDRLQHNPKPPRPCGSLEACAQAQGLLPVTLAEFEAILQNYLSKAQEVGVESSVTEQLQKLSREFFRDGVFVHDQMSFQDFLEDVSDMLEHMVEGSESDDEEDSAIEDEMEEFEREVLESFSAAEVKAGKERGRGRV